MLNIVVTVVLITIVYATNFSVDLRAPTKPFPHFWERCVGSGHAALALRQDYREHLKLAHDELGFKYVRFHGILNDDMSVMRRPTDIEVSIKWKYSFFNIGSIFDYLLSIGMKPLIELSFMPEALQSGPETVFHYKANITPPKNETEWNMLISLLFRHLIARYGIEEVMSWPVEVWNEPNLHNTFWTGTQADYFHFYNLTAHAVKSVSTKIKVGGPATAGSGWIPEFVQFAKKNNVPLDFISTHEYPTDLHPVERNMMQKVTARVRRDIGPDMPLYYTEWNCGLGDYGQGTTFYQDSSYAAPCVVSILEHVQENVDIFSYWTFSDIFEEQGIPSALGHGAFGMMTIYGIRKPVWRAFELLHQAGDQKLIVNGSDSTVDVMALTGSNKQVMIFISNYNVLNATIEPKNMVLTVKGPTPQGTAKLYRIDKNNANAYEAWLAMGSPEYPTKTQLEQLDVRSRLVPITISHSRVDDESYVFNVNVPIYALYVIQYQL